ncbi:MAG: hypothetical protein ACOH1T_08625 [Microbacteriaceae bacterium]
MSVYRATIVASTFVLSALLVGCAQGAPQPDSAQGTDGSVLSGPNVEEGNGDLTGDGMPDVPLEPCGEISNTEVSVGGSRSLWAFELDCATRDAFDVTTANLLEAGFSLESEMSLGGESSVLDRNHFLTETDVGSLEVDVNITGAEGAFELEYIVTETRPD